MPAKSEKQRKFMGAVITAKKTGKGSPEVKKAAKSMTIKQAKHFTAKTPTKK